MNALWVLEAHLGILIGLEYTLWLTIENNLLQFGGINAILAHTGSLIGQLVLEHTLLARNLAPVVSVLLQFYQEPLDDFDKGLIITA